MLSIWRHELEQKLNDEIAKESADIASGACIPVDAEPVRVAMVYRERVGYLAGLRRAIELAEELDKERA